MNAIATLERAAGIARDVQSIGHGASAGWLAGGRLFLQHGPINLIVRADGAPSAVDAACRDLVAAFPAWLGALVDELPRLRAQESTGSNLPAGAIAQCMVAAVRACDTGFVTPMAAVAGAVADHAIEVLAARPGVTRAFVNNGGDIALHLVADERLTIGVVPSLAEALSRASIRIEAATPVRGIATSGWQGRSFSFGIADAVTVLARTAALADTAATLIANAVDVDHPDIVRAPASSVDEDSDLGDRPVTVDVPVLGAAAIETALDRGAMRARRLVDDGIIESALLVAQRRWRMVGAPPLIEGDGA